MDRNDEGRLAITRVVLRPRVIYATLPDAETDAEMHHQAHEDCYIANSVRTEVVVEPVSAQS
jgi:organic hydroperoxide reductase OsmC/OhrA